MGSTFEEGDVIRTRENKAFRVTGKLGAGGMSEVYQALDHSMSRSVVMKLLAPRALMHAERFVQEAKLLANVSSPHVARVYERGETVDGLPYYTMESLKAWSLREVLLARAIKKEYGVRWTVALNMMVDVLEGLAALHEAGIVHRDVKPENVLLAVEHGKQVLKIIDPGIAKLFDDDRLEGLVGTPLYAAPEQLADMVTTPTPASDVFAAGLLFYELVTGHHAYAFYGHDLAAAMDRREKPIPPVTQIRPNVPPAIEAILARMTRIDPNERPGALEVVDMLTEVGLAADGAAQMERGRRLVTESGLRAQSGAKQGRITRADLDAPTDPDGDDVAPNVRYMQMLAEQGKALGFEPLAYVQKMTGGIPPEELDRRLVVGLAETSPDGLAAAVKGKTSPGIVVSAAYGPNPHGGGEIDRSAPTRSSPNIAVDTRTPVMGQESHRRAHHGEAIAPRSPGKGATVPMAPGVRAASSSSLLVAPVDTLPSAAGAPARPSPVAPPVSMATESGPVRPSPVAAAVSVASPSPVPPRSEPTPLPKRTADGSRIRVAGEPVSDRAQRTPTGAELRALKRREDLKFVAIALGMTLALCAITVAVVHFALVRRGM